MYETRTRSIASCGREIRKCRRDGESSTYRHLPHRHFHQRFFLHSFLLVVAIISSPIFQHYWAPRRHSYKSPIVIILSRVFCPLERRVPTHCRARQRNNRQDPVPFFAIDFTSAVSQLLDNFLPIVFSAAVVEIAKKKYKFICRRVLVAWWEKAIDKQTGIS